MNQKNPMAKWSFETRVKATNMKSKNNFQFTFLTI
jgi:hypothetical protein